MAGWNASINLFWVVSYAEKLITLSFCACDAFLAPFQRWFASVYTFYTFFDNFRTDRPRWLSAATTRILRGHYADSMWPLRGFSAVDTWIICVDPRGYPRLSARNNHGILRKKFFRVTYRSYHALNDLLSWQFGACVVKTHDHINYLSSQFHKKCPRDS